VSISWQCKCGQAHEVPDDFPQRVITCPNCLRSVAVPFPEDPLSEDARRYLQGERNTTRKLSKPKKCHFCGWLVWSAGAKECPKCLRKLEETTVVTTIVSFAVLTIVLAVGWFGYQHWSKDDQGRLLESDSKLAVEKIGRELQKADETSRAAIGNLFPGVVTAVQEIEVRANWLSVKYLGIVDGRQQARVTYLANLVLVDAARPEGDPGRKVPRGMATVEQRLEFDGRAWVPSGELEVVDRKQ